MASLDVALDCQREKRSRPLFTQMSVLKSSQISKGRSDLSWRETARWIKFEQGVEEGGWRWCKPFVAALPLTSLTHLRHLLATTASINLQFSGCDDLFQLWSSVLNTWSIENKIAPELRNTILAALLQRHSHQDQPGIRRGRSSSIQSCRKNSLTQLIRSSSSSLLQKPARSYSLVTFSDISELQQLQSIDPNDSQSNMHLCRKLATGSEAANVMVAELDFLLEPLCIFLRLETAQVFTNLTEVPIPTRFTFLLLTPSSPANVSHQIGRSMGVLFSDPWFQRAVYSADTREDLLLALDDFMNRGTLLPASQWNPETRIEPPTLPANTEEENMDESSSFLDLEAASLSDSNQNDLEPSGRLFGGLVSDIKRKVPHYLSDFRDGLNPQCLASFIFLYLASMTPLITFGGLMSLMLDGRMGAVETILARSISGLVWGLTAGQPMAILSCTGPNLVFESIVFYMCQTIGVEYLSFRVWIGLWCMLELLFIVALDLSWLVRYITRFTEESFAALVSVIFIYKAFKQLLEIAAESTRVCLLDNSTDFRQVDINDTLNIECRQEEGMVSSAFLLSVILFFGTFCVAMFLKSIKSSRFFSTGIRQLISDFAVIFSIAIFLTLDFCLGIATPKLSVPQGLEPTFEARDKSWLVPFFGGNPWWTALAAFIPGSLGTIMIFMDQSITTVIANRKENRMKKGCGYHLDLLIVALLTGLLSLFGMPWMIADTVLSMTHVNSLRVESSTAAPGQRPAFLGIREQRLTNVLLAISIGASIFMTSALEMVPMPVLFGVFLFMGLNALNGLQLTDRLKLFFMPIKHQPDHIYLRHVQISRVHLFTCIQLLFFALLWTLKSFKETAALFPLMVGALVGVRKLLDLVFTQYELGFLDDVIPQRRTSGRSDKGHLNLEQPEESEQGEDVENKLRIDENDVEEHQILKFDKADESSRRWKRLEGIWSEGTKALSPIPERTSPRPT